MLLCPSSLYELSSEIRGTDVLTFLLFNVLKKTSFVWSNVMMPRCLKIYIGFKKYIFFNPLAKKRWSLLLKSMILKRWRWDGFWNILLLFAVLQCVFYCMFSFCLKIVLVGCLPGTCCVMNPNSNFDWFVITPCTLTCFCTSKIFFTVQSPLYSYDVNTSHTNRKQRISLALSTV